MIENIYRFHEKVAINTEKGTIYLTLDEAKQVNSALSAAILDIEQHKFVDSPMGTIHINREK